MSYILDALKKSEQQRSKGSIPDVQTIHSSSLNYRNEKKAIWPTVLVVAVLLNFSAITYFIYDRSDNQVASSEPRITEQKPEASSFRTNGITEETVTAQQELNVTTRQEQPAAPVETEAVTEAVTETVAESANRYTPINNASNVSSDQVISFHDLDDDIKKLLPAIIISAHVYSSNPLQRSIVINNNFMEEGEYFMDDLILHEITANGAIFNYHGTLFHYGSVSSWQ